MYLSFGSLRVFISNYVFYSFGFILRYFFRFLHLGDVKKDLNNSPSQHDEKFHNSKVDDFSEDLANFLFWSEDFHERETESSVFNDSVQEEKTECSVLKESHMNDSIVDEIEAKSLDFVENCDDLCHDDMMVEKDEEKEIEGHGVMKIDSDVDENRRNIDEHETEYSVFMENISDVNEDDKKIDEIELEGSVFEEVESNIGKKIDEIERENSDFGDGGFDFDLHGNSEKEETEQKTEDSVFSESETIITTSKYEYISEKDKSCFMEEPTTFRFSFREFYANPNVSSVSGDSYKEFFSKLESEKDFVNEQEEEKEEEESIHSTDIPLRVESNVFGGTDSSDEDYFIFNENSVTSDSESESSSSNGVILGHNNKIDDSFSYEFFSSKNGSEKFESEILKLMMREERKEDTNENPSSFDDKVSKFGVHEAYFENEYIKMEHEIKGLKPFEEHGFEVKDQKEVKCEDELNEYDEDDFEWEHEDIVELLKLELKNARQGGLATIIEEIEDEQEEDDEQEQEENEEQQENESPKVVEELKPMKIEVKLQYRDHMDTIEKVYKGYAEQMKKLDILNYQTMHALGLLQLKDPLKLISIPKSTITNGIISQNLWPRKSTKITSDPFLKIVHELHRDLELVYVGQICLSWEILCWQYMKTIELQQYYSQDSHRYNLVAGEFQLFQVLMQRFIENEPFQSGPRIQNYVKNRCVIRNLLHVPAIKVDNKGGEEDAIAIGKLQDIIKESMRVFWEFIKVDNKDNGNVILKQIGSHLKDPTISTLLVDIRTQLQKKDKKLKDIVRTGNCIVKKFQKHHEEQLDHDQLVAQVGLRLISRVINMSQLRKEQVLWCSQKLNRIKFLSRKIVHVEPSFLLFPC